MLHTIAFCIDKGVKISTGYFDSMAIDEKGDLWTWGYNKYGQLGNETTSTYYAPTKKITNDEETKFKEISAGYYHSMAVDEKGDLWTWGYNNNGQLGNGTVLTST